MIEMPKSKYCNELIEKADAIVKGYSKYDREEDEMFLEWNDIPSPLIYEMCVLCFKHERDLQAESTLDNQKTFKSLLSFLLIPDLDNQVEFANILKDGIFQYFQPHVEELIYDRFSESKSWELPSYD
jgi:hypothetical protein